MGPFSFKFELTGLGLRALFIGRANLFHFMAFDQRYRLRQGHLVK